MEAKQIKEKIKIAQKSVEGLEEPLKSKTYEIVLNKLLSEGEALKIVKGAEQKDDKEQIDDSQIPSIDGKNLPDKIVSLLSSEWGRLPRTLNEIKKALEISGFHYPSTTMSPALIKLTRRGILRRLQKGKTLSYVLAKR